jgi:hypothetical protein
MREISLTKRMAFWHDTLLPHLIASLGRALPQFFKYGLRSNWLCRLRYDSVATYMQFQWTNRCAEEILN